MNWVGWARRVRLYPGLCLALSMWMGMANGAGLTVIYPAYEMADDSRFDDLIEILRVALEKTTPKYGPYELRPSAQGMNEARYLFELQSGQNLNIVWSSTSIEKEKMLLPLRIPLRKGLLGYRIALIAKERQTRIDQIQNIADLQKITIGQGIGWGDVKLYQANGISVKTAQYGGLFKMVAAGRFDLFPRGIGEIFKEFAVSSQDNPNLEIEKNLLIYYPWPYYFFFNQKDAALQQRVERGIRMMLADGSFDTLFRRFNGKAIERARLKERRVIVLRNDMLPKETPLEDASLWFDPAKY